MSINFTLPRLAKMLLLIAAALLVLCWIVISSKVVKLSLGATDQGKWQLNQWYSGKCLLSYYEGPTYKGSTRTAKGLFEWPIAAFPGLTPGTVICIYKLDTTVAVFAIDLTRRSDAGIEPPKSLKDTVLFSNFETRACTKAEVDHLNKHITDNPSTLSETIFALWNSKSPEQLRQDLLYAVSLGTIPNEERNTELKDKSQPQILPEN
jgi:hypothetical protein